MAPVDLLDLTDSASSSSELMLNTMATSNTNSNTSPVNSSIILTDTSPDPAPTPPPPPLLVTTTATTTSSSTTTNKIKLYNQTKLDDNNNDKSSIMVLCKTNANKNRTKDASASSSSGELDEDDEEEVEDSSSSLSTSSLSPLSSFETHVANRWCTNETTEITINKSNSIEEDISNVNTICILSEKTLINQNNENYRGTKRLESDDLSYASDSLTPTPTPSALNGHDEKFVEFSSSSSSNLNTPTLAPPPNTLPLFTNLNQTTNNLETVESNTDETRTTTTSAISADSPEFIPSSLAAGYSQPTPLHHLVYSQTGDCIDGEYMNYVYSEPSYSYGQTTPDSSTLMSPIGELNPTLVNEGVAAVGVAFQPLPPNLAAPTASSSTIFVHVDAGHIFQVHLGDKCKEIVGPATVKIVSNDSTQPFPLQLTSPAPGQLVQQILNENGMLTHLIISSQPQYMHAGGSGMHVPNMNGTISHHPNYHHLQSESSTSNLIHVS